MDLQSCITIFRRLEAAAVLALLFFGLLSPLIAEDQAPQTRIRLIVNVTGIRNDKGPIVASLFGSEKGFPDDDACALRHQLGPIKDGRATLVFDDLAPGQYGLALLHDENENNKIDTNRFGFPREGYGISNNPRPTRRAPKFSDARFLLTQTCKEQTIQVKIIYLRLGDVLR